MKLRFSGRLQGCYQPKDITKFNNRVPLNVVGRGVIQIGDVVNVGVTTDQVIGYRCTLWVDANEVTVVHDRMSALVGRYVSFDVDHSLVPVKVAGSTITQIAWRDTLELDTLAVE